MTLLRFRHAYTEDRTLPSNPGRLSFPLCVESDPDEVKFIGGDSGDCGAVCAVVGRGEEITREDRERSTLRAIARS